MNIKTIKADKSYFVCIKLIGEHIFVLHARKTSPLYLMIIVMIYVLLLSMSVLKKINEAISVQGNIKTDDNVVVL